MDQLTKAMDEVVYLRCLLAERETELRLVKQQLSQAQVTIHYLANLASGANSLPRALGLGASGVPAKLTAASQITGASSLDDRSAIDSAHSQIQQRSPKTSGCGGDLLTFDGEDSTGSPETWTPACPDFGIGSGTTNSFADSAIGTPLTPLTPADAHIDSKPSRLAVTGQLIGLGISGLDDEQELDRVGAAENSNVTSSTLSQAKCDDILSSNEPFSETKSSFGASFASEKWTACRPRPWTEQGLIFDRPFTNAEHNRMTGAAVFVEEMTEEEQLQHWESLEHESGARHTAADWKLYYDEIVRPIYLVKIGQGAIETDSGAEPTDSETESDGPEMQEYFDAVAVHDAPEPEVTTLTADEVAPNTSNSAVAEIGQDRGALRGSTSSSPTIEHYKPSSIGSSISNTNLVGRDTHQDIVETTSSELAAPRPDRGQFPRSQSESNDSDHMLQVGYAGWADRPTDRSAPRPWVDRPPTDVRHLFYRFDSGEEYLCRTVLISNIPINISLADIVHAVRGGKVVSAQLLKTAGMKSTPAIDTNAAMIVFLGPRSAKAYVEFTATSPVYFWSVRDAASVQARVEMIPTPSRPLSPRLLTDFANGLSRILFIVDADKRWDGEQIVEELSHFGVKVPIEARRDQDGMLVFEFADARDAAAAWQVVDRRSVLLAEAQKGFLPDPCAGSWESIGVVGEPGEDGLKGEDKQTTSRSSHALTVDETAAYRDFPARRAT